MNVKCNVEECKFNENNKCVNDEIKINFCCDDYEYAYCSNYTESEKYIESYYDIQKLNGLSYDYIVFNRSIDSATHYIKHIADNVKEENKDIIIFLFDNLLRQGNEEGRYIKVIWSYKEDDIIEMNLARISKKDEIRKTSMEYFKEQKELIEYSILNSAQKKLILKGVAI